MSYVYVVTVWGHTGDSNTQPGSGDTWRHVSTRGSSLLSLMSPGRRARALAACYLLQLGGQSLYLLLIRLFPLVGLDSSEALQLVLCCDPSVAQPVFTITEKALLGAFSVIVQLHRLIVHSSTQHQHHHISHTSTSTPATSASPTPPLSSLSAPPQFFISTYLLLRDLEGLEVVADHPELLLQLHDLGLAGLGSLLRALEVGLHHGELPGDLGSSALDGALLS